MNSHPINGHSIVVKSLNHLLRSHLLTYVSLRIFAESLPTKSLNEWVSDYIKRKSATNRTQTYCSYHILKGIDSQQKVETRICTIGSPSTQITETWVLSKLGTLSEFVPPSSVYSYQWPQLEDASIFEHYMRGYKRRELDIVAACKGESKPPSPNT